MKKNNILLVTACVVSFQSLAGGYSGLNLGLSSVVIKKELTYPLEADTPTTAHSHSAYTHFHGQFLAGYELSLNAKLRAALEANADLFTGTANHTVNEWYFNQDAKAEEQLDYGFGLFLLPAYQYNETSRFFIGPGLSTARFITRSGETSGNLGVSGAFKHWLTGVGLKTGIASQLSSTLDLLFTYQYTQYHSVTWTETEPLSGETLSGHYRPSAHTVLVGLRVNLPDGKIKNGSGLTPTRVPHHG